MRPSRPEDADALIAIEAEAWIDAPEMRTSPETIRERIENNASMNFVVEEIAGDVVRCMYAQYVDDVEDLLNATWEWKESNRREPGSTKVVQLLDVFVDQSFAARCVSRRIRGQELRNHVLNYAEHAGVRHACAVTRTRGFRQAQKHRPTLTYDEYVLGGSMDRGVFFHTSAAPTSCKSSTVARADYENDGNGVLIRYDVREYAHSNAARRGRSALPSRLRRPSDPTRHREDGRYVSPLEAARGGPRDLFPWCESTNERASERGRFYKIPSRDPSLFLSTKFNICCIPNELLRARADRRRRHISPHSEMTHGSLGLFPPPVATFSTFRTTNIPSPKTLPNTTCLSSNHSVLAHVMKN